LNKAQGVGKRKSLWAGTMKQTNFSNEEIADALDRIADLLKAQDANRYRVNAYRRAARVVSDWETSVSEMAVSEGEKKLMELPDIGKGIAAIIREYVHTGRIALLERLEGQISPEDLFTTVPGIGETLAHRIHRALDIESLEGLELVAHDGRLEQVSGIGIRRTKAIRDSVGAILDRSGRRRAHRIHRLEKTRGTTEAAASHEGPAVAAILEVDAEYRRRAAAGLLKTIAPRRFNPEGKSWLPIFHTEKDGWHFTALFSNTARAHELNRVRDWVVMYIEKDSQEKRYTVVTEYHGPLAGRRVIRGLDNECRAYYAVSQP
jgi:predicted house-cleaning noncanonical NTP pyrophosphatase (MazG superfamily)